MYQGTLRDGKSGSGTSRRHNVNTEEASAGVGGGLMVQRLFCGHI